MKMTKMLILLVTAFLICLTSIAGILQAQSNSDLAMTYEAKPDIIPFEIHETDYTCLTSLDCLRNNHLMAAKGWNVSFNNMGGQHTSQYVLNGTGENEVLRAIYDSNGRMIEAIHTRKNTRLPSAIRNFIASGEYKDWTMTANEMSVRDFNPEKTTYVVNMRNQNQRHILHFNHKGENVKRTAPIVITSDDYSCLKSIDCLKNSPKFRERGWRITFDGNRTGVNERYELRSQSDTESLYARYDSDGELVEADFRRKNTTLPRAVREYLVTEKYTDWTMTANEMSVRNFESDQTTYKVTLEKGNHQKELHFNSDGERIKN
jgi:hypothetical protein